MSEEQALEALAREIIEAARRKKATIATAESCTGGLVAHLLTQVSGASSVFEGGWVLYSNRRKTEDLAVHPEIMARHGAVSRQVAETMAQSARRRAGVTYAVSTSGIAGPTGGTEGKPIGTCWIGRAGPDGVLAVEVSTGHNDRDANKRAFARRALEMLGESLRQ